MSYAVIENSSESDSETCFSSFFGLSSYISVVGFFMGGVWRRHCGKNFKQFKTTVCTSCLGNRILFAYLSNMLYTIQEEYPDALPDVIHTKAEQFEQEAKLAMAAKLYELQRLSTRKAAQLIGIHRAEFIMRLQDIGVALINSPRKRTGSRSR